MSLAQEKLRAREQWGQDPCGAEYDREHELGTREFFDEIERHRYNEYAAWMPRFMGFEDFRGARLLEIGCGMGTDLLQFSRGGARCVGIDLTPRSIEITQHRFKLYGAGGAFMISDGEHLPFCDESFDVVYSNGVLHHTPDTEGAIREVHRVLRPGGTAKVMLYHRNSYNYRVNISMLRRAGVHLLRWNSGLKLVKALTGEPEESLRIHATQLKADSSYLTSEQFLSQNTDGAGNPLARVYSRDEASELFKDFARVEVKTFFLNKRWIPIVGPVLSRSLESKLASRWGWHLWVYATK